ATALEAGPHGVTCNAINPGYVLTPLVKGQIADQATANGISEDEVLDQVFLGHSAVPKLAEPDDIAAIALFLAGEHAAVANGSARRLDGGWPGAWALPGRGPASGRGSASGRGPASGRGSEDLEHAADAGIAQRLVTDRGPVRDRFRELLGQHRQQARI